MKDEYGKAQIYLAKAGQLPGSNEESIHTGGRPKTLGTFGLTDSVLGGCGHRMRFAQEAAFSEGAKVPGGSPLSPSRALSRSKTQRGQPMDDDFGLGCCDT